MPRARGLLEFHHREPYAAGGAALIDNIELRCNLCRYRHKHYAEWQHNQFEAVLYFGDNRPDAVRERLATY